MSRDILKWVDIETTGLDYKKDQILEVGLVVTDMNLEVLMEHSMPLWGNKQEAAWNRATEFVIRMHEENGLINDCRRLGGSLGDFAAEIAQILDPKWIDSSDPMCGSSVQFDRTFLTRDMPKTIGALFSYRNIDVSSIKETVERFRPALAEARDAHVIPRKRHRVIPDIRDTIEEYRFYMLHLGLLGGKR